MMRALAGARHMDVTRFVAGTRLFTISALILFLELACIRWFPAHVLFLTFFTNTVLLACFLGMSIGCLAANRSQNYLRWTPFLLGLALLAGLGVERLRGSLARLIDVGRQAAPQMIFFGTEYYSEDLSRFAIPMEFVCGFFFLVIALALVGPGQELGRALNAYPHRLQAYTLNILGSLAGIGLFAAMSWQELSPFWWFLVIAAGLGCFLVERRYAYWMLVGSTVVALVWLGGFNSGPYVERGDYASEHLWSPYYRIDYNHTGSKSRSICVNLISHQLMVRRDDPSPAYALPHLLNRDSGGRPFQDVLIIGAGSGNDVSRALQWGARHIDAVEIDPVIYRIGYKDHPDRPYQDQRVQVHIDDGRNFFRATDRKYDLIVYALVDSLVLQSSHSNIRLESYLFTQQAFADVKRHLKPDGLFAMYNIFRQGWLVSRLQQGLTEAFGAEPLVVPLSYRETVKPDDVLFREFTLFLAGDTSRLREQFARHHHYMLNGARTIYPEVARTPNGFGKEPEDAEGNSRPSFGDGRVPDPLTGWVRLGAAKIVPPNEPLKLATDDWPFLYLRRPMIPDLSLRGMAIMGGLSLVLMFWFLPRRKDGEGSRQFHGQMFFLGAGFMLVETKAVVQMALLFGGTWIVNSFVFAAILAMILAANALVLTIRPQRTGPFYWALFGALALNLLPIDLFLGMARSWQIACSCLLVSLPIFFAGVIFALTFSRSSEPDRALGSNVAGAILGGLAEYTSMVLGFQSLMLVGIGFYALSWLLGRRSPTGRGPTEDRVIAMSVTVEGDRLGLPPNARSRSLLEIDP